MDIFSDDRDCNRITPAISVKGSGAKDLNLYSGAYSASSRKFFVAKYVTAG